MMEAMPDLRPTTAIRKLGISDPSTIRRLRDKYKAQRDDIHIEVRRSELFRVAEQDKLNDNTAFRLPTEAARQALLRKPEDVRRSPKKVIRKSQSQTAKRNELSCLLAIGAHALAQAAAYCAEWDEDRPFQQEGSVSQSLLTQMLFMMSTPTAGEETTAS